MQHHDIQPLSYGVIKFINILHHKHSKAVAEEINSDCLHVVVVVLVIAGRFRRQLRLRQRVTAFAFCNNTKNNMLDKEMAMGGGKVPSSTTTYNHSDDMKNEVSLRSLSWLNCELSPTPTCTLPSIRREQSRRNTLFSTQGGTR